MTPRETALAIALRWLDETDITNARVVALMAHIEIAITDAVKNERRVCAEIAEGVSVKLHESRGGEYGYNDALKMSDGAQMVADALRGDA